MRNPFYIFRLKREERWPSLAVLLYLVLWNALVVSKYAGLFFKQHKYYHWLFVHHFHISGYDPLSDVVLSQWSTEYNIYRHPLLAFFMYLPNQINQGLMMLTDRNCATVVMAVILVACGFYSFILLYRIFREVVGLRQTDSWLLAWLTFSFGYVMVSVSVPDHFALSMFMLILTLYVAGRKIKASHPFTKWQTVVFFVVTAGISLNNGIKIFLANLFTNGRRFFRPANLLLAILLPSALIWITARMEYRYMEYPRYMARQKANARKDSVKQAKMYAAFRDTTTIADSALAQKAFEKIVAKKKEAKAKRQQSHAGKPINKTEFGKWTDITTPRWPSLVENFFGEPIQLHQDHLLGDVLRSRPIIVHYRYAFNYIVEAIVALLFLAGIWCGRRSRFLWLALSFMGFDLFIHFILGFGINEAYIMSPHWLFALTIAMAYLISRVEGTYCHRALRALLAVLVVYLVAWNGYLYTSYLF